MAHELQSTQSGVDAGQAPRKAKAGNNHYLREAQRLSTVAKKRKEENARKDAEIAHLRQEIRTNKHRSAFDRLANDAGVHSEAIADAFVVSGYRIETDEPDELSIRSAIDRLKQTKKYFFSAKSSQTAVEFGAEAHGDDGSSCGNAENDADEGDMTSDTPCSTPVAKHKKTKSKAAPGGKTGGGTGAPTSNKLKASQLADPEFIRSKTPKEMAALIKAGIDWE